MVRAPTTSETSALKAIRQALNATRRCRVVRNQVGSGWMTRGPAKGGEQYWTVMGLGLGSPDLVGTLRSGRVFCIEVKSASGRLNPDQRSWHKAARPWGIYVGVARSVEEALACLARAESGALADEP